MTQERIILSDIMIIDLVDNHCQVRCKLPDQKEPCRFFSYNHKNFCTNPEGWRNRFPTKTYYRLSRFPNGLYYHVLRERFPKGIPEHFDQEAHTLYKESKQIKRAKWFERKRRGRESGKKGKNSDISELIEG